MLTFDQINFLPLVAHQVTHCNYAQNVEYDPTFLSPSSQ